MSARSLGLPKLSRIWLIAMRDFMGYVKTWGFWLSFLFPVIFGVLGYMFQTADIDLSPPRYETVLDETGVHGAAIQAYYLEEQKETRVIAVKAMAALIPEADREEFTTLVDAEGPDAGLEELRARYPSIVDQIEFPDNSLIFVDPPASTLAELTPWLDGDRMLDVDGRSVPLNGVIVIRGTETQPQPQYWSKNFNNAPAERLINRYFRDQAKRAYLASSGLTLDGYDEVQQSYLESGGLTVDGYDQTLRGYLARGGLTITGYDEALGEYLASGGLTAEGYDAALEGRTRVALFDPEELSGAGEDEAAEVSMLDRLPFIVGIGLAFFLLMSIFAGAFMLLTSMIEEKMNKLLEMMLASTRFSEIMLGKMLGAAMLTFASFAPYILFIIVGLIGFLLFGNPDQVAAIQEAFPLSTIIISIIFLVLGYVFYAAILIALGAMAQSMQDAQTLSLPVMLVMFLGLGVIVFGMSAPDSPIITFASIFPLTSPFAMMIRLASDPPLWQILLSIALLFASVVGVMWICARIFRFGVLSGSGVGAMKAWFNRVILRRITLRKSADVTK